MVDGDQLNVVVDPIIIQVAKRNIKQYDIIPLFYDANKAAPEMVSKESQFHGLMRAHEYSNIGEISNMLTRLWNRNKPDILAAALLTYLNNLRIDGAKTGAVNEYTNYPEIAKRINKATGGKNGRLPYFFQFSKNGRADKTNGKKKRSWAKTNNSTMNRICAAFDDIGNINMNFAGIPPFNWQMLMDGPCLHTRPEIIEDFVALSNLKLSVIICNAEDPLHKEENLSRTAIVEDRLQSTLTRKYGSLEKCYPYVCKYLFTGENASRASHKQTFWKIFGEIAIRNLRKNLANCSTCPRCQMKIPNWTEDHQCPKNSQGFYKCIDCGKLCERQNSRQCRCGECQEHHRRDAQRLSKERSKQRRKERAKQYTILWQLH